MTPTQSACMASRPLRIPGRVVSVKLHPQEVPAARGHAIRNVQTQRKSTVPDVLPIFTWARRCMEWLETRVTSEPVDSIQVLQIADKLGVGLGTRLVGLT